MNFYNKYYYIRSDILKNYENIVSVVELAIFFILILNIEEMKVCDEKKSVDLKNRINSRY